MASVTLYLRGLAAVCLECADCPALLPSFLAIIRLVPATVSELRAAAGRIAAPQLQRDRMRCYSALDILQ
jgi:hypothetical protein